MRTNTATSHNRCSTDLENPTNSVGFSDSETTRFWAHVDRNGPLPTHQPRLGPCWLWTSAQKGRPAFRYGAFSVTRGLSRGQAPRSAHRIAWELTRGPIPHGLSVLHRCDVTLCVNPGHLFLGTQLDNMQDAARKGRLHVRRPKRQKVSDDDVAQIIAMRQAGLKLVVIADKLCVSKTFVSLVARGLRRQYDPARDERRMA